MFVVECEHECAQYAMGLVTGVAGVETRRRGNVCVLEGRGSSPPRRGEFSRERKSSCTCGVGGPFLSCVRSYFSRSLLSLQPPLHASSISRTTLPLSANRVYPRSHTTVVRANGRGARPFRIFSLPPALGDASELAQRVSQLHAVAGWTGARPGGVVTRAGQRQR